MSLDLERGKKSAPIEMPPLPPEEPMQEAIIEAQPINQGGEGESDRNTSSSATSHAPEEQVIQKNESLQSKESVQAKNFRELREKADRAARERDDLAQQIKELKSQLTQKDDFSLNPDDLVEGKHLAQVMKEQKELKEQLRQYSQQRHLAEAEIRLKSKYTDFDQVVNEKNILALKEINPQRAETIKSIAAHNPEEALALAYSAIKENNLYEEPKRHDQDMIKAQQNYSKPRPLNTVSAQHTDSPISRMNAFAQGELTPEMQKQHFKEMQEARKGY
jgi:hypothetical protein